MNILFYAQYIEKKYLVTFLLENKLSRQYKHGFKKKAKLAFLHDFGQKVEVFSSFVFIKNRSRKSVLLTF